MKKQIFIIHGGMTFRSQKDYLYYLKNRKAKLEPKIRWSDAYIKQKLERKFDILKPRMPLQDNAKYNEWKICFESYLPLLLKKDIILIGVSLGAIFLAKYLSENKLKKKAISVYLVAAPYDNSLPSEDLVGGFRLGTDLSLLERNTRNLYFVYSADDDAVPISHAEKYRKKLKKAEFIIFESKNGHFIVSELPEIVEMIQMDIKDLN